MQKILGVLMLSLFLISCGGKKSQEQQYGEVSDKCAIIDAALIGTFATAHQEGNMVFSGGLNGTVDIFGKDYNDITCSYLISDCSTNKMSMNCNGAPYETDLIVFSRDSIQIGLTHYARVK